MVRSQRSSRAHYRRCRSACREFRHCARWPTGLPWPSCARSSPRSFRPANSAFLSLVCCVSRRWRCGSGVASAVAVLATSTPFVFPLLGGDGQGTAGQLAADVLLVAGTSWSVWSLYFLGRNLSVIAQARGVADGGPYRFVRHPLYGGEIISSLGLAVAVSSVPAFAVWLALIAMQVYRAVREEQVLVQALPQYRDYRACTAALLPGVF